MVSEDPDPNHLGDRALVRRILDGDESAFESFFDEHYPRLYRFAFSRLRDADETRELVQAAVCKAIAHLGKYRGEAPLAGWVFTICRHEIHRHFKRRRRSPEPGELREEAPEVRAALDAAGANPASPEETVGREQIARLVHEVLDRLPSHYGHALEWKYLDGLPVKEIARRLELAPKAAESLLTRARLAFRESYASASQSGRHPSERRLSRATVVSR